VDILEVFCAAVTSEKLIAVPERRCTRCYQIQWKIYATAPWASQDRDVYASRQDLLCLRLPNNDVEPTTD
jgi:hypothetical protein